MISSKNPYYSVFSIYSIEKSIIHLKKIYDQIICQKKINKQDVFKNFGRFHQYHCLIQRTSFLRIWQWVSYQPADGGLVELADEWWLTIRIECPNINSWEKVESTARKTSKKQKDESKVRNSKKFKDSKTKNLSWRWSI